MRENRTYGSEGGEAKAFPTPISEPNRGLRKRNARVRDRAAASLSGPSLSRG